jgi:hypothetical protein
MKKMIGKIFCSLGYHIWTYKLEDCINEFGYVPLDSRLPSTSKCSRCNKNYEDGK